MNKSGISPKKGRLVVGGAIFVAGQLSPLITIPLLTKYSLSAEMVVLLSGVLFTLVPPLFTLTAVAFVGKAGFVELRRMAFGWLKSTVFKSHVSRFRYRVGLVLFVVPLLLAWLDPYLRVVTDESFESLRVAISGDLMLMLALLVLGGDFWEKLRLLFSWDAP